MPVDQETIIACILKRVKRIQTKALEQVEPKLMHLPIPAYLVFITSEHTEITAYQLQCYKMFINDNALVKTVFLPL